MDNLIQLIGQQVTPDILRKASALTGESEAATQSGLNALLPTLVGAFAHKGANENGAKKMMDWVSAQGDSDQFLGSYGGMFDNAESSDWLQDTGGALVSWLMGSKADDSAGMISSMAGIGNGSSSTLMKIMAPLALAVIGKQALGGNMGAGGLASMLLGQKSFVQAAAPAGLMGLLGLNSFDDLGKATTNSYATTTTTTTTSSSSSSVSSSSSASSSSGVAAPSVSTSSVTTDVSGVSVPSFQSGNVVATGIETPSVSTPSVSTPSVSTPSVSAPAVSTPNVSVPDAKIETPSISTPDVKIEAPSVSTPDVKIETPAVSTPDVKIATPSISSTKMDLPDVDLPTATVDTLVPEKPLYTKVEADRRDFAFKSGRPDLPGGSAAGVTVDKPSASFERSSSSAGQTSSSSAGRAKATATEVVTDEIVEEKPLFNKVLRDKRDIPFGNFGGRWFGWTVVTAAVSAGLLYALNLIPAFFGMFTGA